MAGPVANKRVFIVLAVAAAALFGAQNAFAGKTPTFADHVNYTVGTSPRALATGDLNGDGIPDLVATDNGGNNRVSVLLGNADGTFQAKVDYNTFASPYAVAIGDLNGDGHPDLAVTYDISNSASKKISVLLNAGDGTFPSHQEYGPDSTSRSYGVAIADFNGDGKLDIAASFLDESKVHILLGVGDGTFPTDASYNTDSAPIGISAADLNGDGYPDLAVTSSNGNPNAVSILLNNGDGTFATKVNYPTGAIPQSISIGDLNGDGHPDLVVTNYLGASFSVLLGNGDGTFAAKTDYAIGGHPNGLTLADINQDGKLDVVTADTDDGTVSVLLGAGDGTLGPRMQFNAALGPYSVVTGDFNRDGAPDIVVANLFTHNVSVLLQTTTYTRAPVGFQAHQEYPVGTTPEGVATADLNGDGKLDLVTPNSNSGNVSVQFGNGDGTFGQSATNYSVGNAPYSVAVGDLNGDGHPDLVAGNAGDSNVSVLLGDGAGGFGAATNFSTGNYPISIAIADFNGDGRPDLAVANFQGPSVSILLGNGDGSFQTKTDYTTALQPRGVVVGDFNGDGKLDLALSGFHDDNVSVLLGNGNGTFQTHQDYSVAVNGQTMSPLGIATGDLNGDGKLDLVTADYTGHAVSVLLGDGSGAFPTHVEYSTGASSQAWSVAVADVDGDGKPDIAASDANGNKVALLRGVGDGTLQDVQSFDTGQTPDGIAIGDFNGDGEPDVATSSLGANQTSVLLQHGPLDHFVVEAGGGGPIDTQFAGTGFDVRMTAADYNGTTDTDFEGTVDLSSNTTCADPGCGTTASFAAGVLTTSVTLVGARPDATLTVTRTGGSETGTSNAFVVKPAELDHFAVEADGGGSIGTQFAGTPFSVQITAQDQYGNTQVDFNGTVDLSSNRTCTSGCVTTSAFSGGVLTGQSITLTGAGIDSTVTATETGGAHQGTSSAFVVKAAGLDHFGVEAQGGGNIPDHTAGDNFFVTFTAYDQYGNVQADFNDAGDITGSLDGSCQSCGSQSFSNGVTTREIQLTKAADQAVRVVVNGGTYGVDPSGESNQFHVAPAALDHFAVMAHGGGDIGTQTAGQPFSIDVVAQDAYDNTQTDYNSAVNISASSSCAAGCGTSPAFTEGFLMDHSMALTGADSGIQVNVHKTSGLQAGSSNQFTVSPAAASKVAWTDWPHPLVSGTSGSLKAKILDQYGNTVDSSADVTFSKISGAGNATGFGTVAAVHGLATKVITGTIAGAITVQASSAGLTAASQQFGVTVGTATKLAFTSATTSLASGTTRTLQVQVRDAAGNTVTSPAHTVTFAKTAGAGTVTGLGSISSSFGTASKAVKGALAGAITIKATSSGLTAATTSFIITPGHATKLVFTSSTAALKVGQIRTLTVQVRDAAGNKVASPAHTVTFAKASGAGTVSGLGSVSSSAGNASKTVKATAKGAITIKATSTGLTAGTTSFTITS